jgi:PAS domain S-box-containing protein
VRRFTPAAEALLNLVPGDIGRPLTHIKLGLADLPELEPLLTEVLDTMTQRELEVRDKRGTRYVMRLRPYRTLDNRIEGVVVMLVDIEVLKRAHDFTASIVATVREPLLVLDAEQRVQLASESFYRDFQVKPDETEGRLLYELGNGQWDIPELHELLAALLPRDHRIDDYEVEHTFEHLGRRTMQLNARRLLQPDDRSPALILMAIEDITERKQAQSAMAQLAAVVTFSKDAIISKDLDGIVTSWNRGAEELFGYSAKEMVGQPVSRLIPDDHLDEEPQILQRIRRGEVIEHYETVRRRKDGSLVDIALTVSPLRDAGGAIVGASKIVRDVSQRKRDEEALRQSEARFRTLAAELAEADRHKNEFLAMLAHELRNPLGPIRNELQIMRMASDNGEAKALEVMERQVRQMVRLVDDLLDMSRVSRGRVELRIAPVDLVSIVRDAAETLRAACAAKGIELTLALPDHPVIVNGDAVRLAQVVGNLLGNACKYTDTGNVWVVVEREGDATVVRVRDSGIGIAANHLPHVFDLFMQIDHSLERSGSGLGIGLTLVKTLVDLHGGTVQVDSKGLGLGSEFVVRLPMAAADVDALGPAADESGEIAAVHARRRILVVDDNRDAAESLAQLLQLSGHETHLAHDGLEAVDAAATFRPEVVLLDIGLPKLNGYDAARRMRETAWGKDMVMVALTGWGQDEDRQKSAGAGFDAHLVKPVDPETLMTLLADLPQRDRAVP